MKMTNPAKPSNEASGQGAREMYSRCYNHSRDHGIKTSFNNQIYFTLHCSLTCTCKYKSARLDASADSTAINLSQHASVPQSPRLRDASHSLRLVHANIFLLVSQTGIHFTTFHTQVLLAKEGASESDANRLDLCVVAEGILAQLATNTGLLEATEGHLVAEHVVVVDPDGAGLQGVGNTDGGVEVGGVHGSGKAVGTLVAGLDDFLLGLELADGADGAEDFFLHDLHVRADVGEDGGLDEVALVAVTFTASLDLGTGFLAGLDVLHDSVELELANLRTLEGLLVEWVADDVLCRSFSEFLNELVVDTRLDIDSGASTAALAVVEENTKVDPRDGVLKVGVVEDNVGRLATEFKGDLLQVGLGSRLEDVSAGNGGAGKGNLVDVHVAGDGSTSGLAEAGKDVDNTGRETGLLDKGGSIQTRQRGLFGGLQDDSVTGGQGRSDLPGPHKEREVPGNDLTANANRLMSGVVEGLWVCVDGLAVDLVCPSTIVSQAA